MSTATPPVMDALVHVTSRLIAVMEQEVACLRTMELGAVARLREEKDTLVAAYEDGIRQLAANPDALHAMEPAFKDELRALAARFDQAVTENSQALNAVRDTQERMLRAIVDAVAEDRARGAGYSCTGAVPRPAGAGRNAKLSLTLDRRL